jgi:antirestriction protein ArdC
VSKRAYTGVNAFIIGFFGTDDYYLTFNQIKALGGRLEEGTESLPIQFYTKLDPKKIKNFKPKNGALIGETKPFFMARFYKVFPLNKCNLPDFKRATFTLDFKPIEQAEKLASRCLTPVTFGGSSAFFKPSAKTINLPERSRFKSQRGTFTQRCSTKLGTSTNEPNEQRSKPNAIRRRTL